MAETVTKADLQRYQQQAANLPNGHPEKTKAMQVLAAYAKYQRAQNSPAAQYQRAYEEAKAANEKRYNQIVRGYKGREGQAMQIANLAANQYYRQANAASMQDLVSRGVRNSTEAAYNSFDNYERSQQIPLQAYMATSGDTLGFMERRNDTYPDYGQMLALAQAQGQGAGAGLPVGGGGGGQRFLPRFPGAFGGAVRQPAQPGKTGDAKPATWAKYFAKNQGAGNGGGATSSGLNAAWMPATYGYNGIDPTTVALPNYGYQKR